MGLQQLGSLLFRRQAQFYVTRLPLCFIAKFRVTLRTVSLYSNMEIRTSWSLMLPWLVFNWESFFDDVLTLCLANVRHFAVLTAQSFTMDLSANLFVCILVWSSKYQPSAVASGPYYYSLATLTPLHSCSATVFRAQMGRPEAFVSPNLPTPDQMC